MKVVIFCGGLGVRMGEETQRIPKPMIRIGNRPMSLALDELVPCLVGAFTIPSYQFLFFN